jgi:hypothetical protein
MRPPWRRRIPGKTSWVSRTRPKKLVSNWRRISAIGTCSTGPYSPYPALLISVPTARVRFYGGDGLGHGGLVGHVQRQRGDTPGREVGKRFCPPGRRVYAQPGTPQAGRGGTADPGRAAGDENGFRERSSDHGATPFSHLAAIR